MGSNRGASDQVFYVPLSERRLQSPWRVRSECCIFKVHNPLREMMETAYKPEIVAIGPYHRNRGSKKNSSSKEEEEERSKDNFSMMEEHKFWYLQRLLELKGVDVGFFIQAIPNVERVRNFYAEPLHFSNNELVEMMVLDGCFIIELLRKFYMPQLQDPDDPVFKKELILNSLQRDLMLFENQLPFFVLNDLFSKIVGENQDDGLLVLVLSFFEHILPDPRKDVWNQDGNSLGKVNHLLELIHVKWCSKMTNERLGSREFNLESSRETISESSRETTHESSRETTGSTRERRLICCGGRNRTDGTGDMRSIRCATELKEAGVEFEMDEGKSLFDIRFRKGKLQIPALDIERRTEAFLRNLAIYEHYWDRNPGEHRPKFVTEYLCFLDHLIDTSKDVEILCRQGIINNLLGDDDEVSDIFNRVSRSIILAGRSSYYYEIEKRLNSHCKKRWNRWIATLRHNHFNSPWGITSVVAGFILLAATLTQAYFSVFPRK